MPSVSPTSNPSGAYDAALDTIPGNRASTGAAPGSQSDRLPDAPSPQRAASDARLRTRRSFHPDIAATGAGPGAPEFQHGFQMRAQTLANVEALFKGTEDMSPTGRAQDQAMADMMCEISRVDLPRTMKANDGVVLPPDLMAYWVRHEGESRLLYTCPEINGTGFGGIATMPQRQFKKMMDTHRDAARDIMADAHKLDEQPLLLVANSGREGAKRVDGEYPPGKNSAMIWEKAHVADHYARTWSQGSEETFPQSLDRITTPYYQAVDAAKSAFGEDSPRFAEAERTAHAAACREMAKLDGKPLVLLGYSIDIAAVCRIQDGRATLFGRPVNGLLNDRAAENLNMVQMNKLDFQKMALINSTVEEGVNKFAAAMARAEFAASPEAAALPRIAAERGFKYDVRGLDKAFHFTDPNQRGEVEGMSTLDLKAHYSTFFRGVEAHEGIDGIMKAFDDFAALGHDTRPLFKPNGTGQSKGIIGVGFKDTREVFRQRFLENEAQLKKDFGAGAGYPYHVQTLVDLDRTKDGNKYDLRFTILQSRQPSVDQHNRLNPRPVRTMHAFPLLWKEEVGTGEKHDGPVEFGATNVTASVASTGRPASDFVKPLCTPETMRECGMDENLAKSISLYFSSFYAYVLQTRYARPEHPEVRLDGGGRLLPFPAQTTRAVTQERGGAPVGASGAHDDAAHGTSRAA